MQPMGSYIMAPNTDMGYNQVYPHHTFMDLALATMVAPFFAR